MNIYERTEPAGLTRTSRQVETAGADGEEEGDGERGLRSRASAMRTPRFPCRKAALVAVALLAAALAACRPEPRVEAAREEIPDAARAARGWLAQRLSVPPAELTVLASEQRQWSDSCLGLGGPAESCLQAITPGWKVTLARSGKRYEVRTDEALRVFRSPQLPPSPPGPPGARAASPADVLA